MALDNRIGSQQPLQPSFYDYDITPNATTKKHPPAEITMFASGGDHTPMDLNRNRDLTEPSPISAMDVSFVKHGQLTQKIGQMLEQSPHAPVNLVSGEFGAKKYRSSMMDAEGPEDNMGEQIQGAISSLANVCNNFDRANRRVSNKSASLHNNNVHGSNKIQSFSK